MKGVCEVLATAIVDVPTSLLEVMLNEALAVGKVDEVAMLVAVTDGMDTVKLIPAVLHRFWVNSTVSATKSERTRQDRLEIPTLQILGATCFLNSWYKRTDEVLILANTCNIRDPTSG